MTLNELLPLIIPGFLIQLLIIAWYIRHCWENQRLTGRQKAIWIILIALFNLLGTVIYLSVTRPNRQSMNEPDERLIETGTQDEERFTDEASPYSAASQTRQATLIFLIVAYEVFALRMIYENQSSRYYFHLVLAAGISFVLMLVISFFSGRIRYDTIRLALPFFLLLAAGVLVFLDHSQSSLIMILAIVAVLINSYQPTWEKIYFAAYLVTYIVMVILQSARMNPGPVLMTDQLISRLYSDGLFFMLVFAAFYSLKRQYQLNAQLERSLEITRSQTKKLQELSLLNERQRIIGEIHDTVGHTLTTAVIALEDGNQLLERDPVTARSKFVLAQQQTRQSLADLRNAIKTIQAGHSASFEERLNQLNYEIMRTTSLKISSILEMKSTPLPIQQTVLLNAVKEFSTNSLKHGKSHQIDLLLQEFDEAYHLIISDDGQGTGQIVLGFGLQTIRNRAESLGGTMRAESQPGEGFTLHLSIPAGKPSSDQIGRNERSLANEENSSPDRR